MIITKEMLNKKVPKDMFPTRFDSATDLYINTKKGLLLYNINPTTWNLLYPFFAQSNKFTINSYNIKNKDITFKELIDIYKEVYNREYVEKQGYNEDKRKQVLIEEFNDTFKLNNTTINDKLDFHYELKYSKSKNVYTFYYLESYIVNRVDFKSLISQRIYPQEFLDLDSYNNEIEINGVKLVDSLIYILKDKEKIEILKNNVLKL